MFRFISTIDGVEDMNRAFNRTEGYVVDMRNFAQPVSQEFYQIEVEQFASEGAAGASGQWAPLSTAYERFKAREFPGETILRATGHMEDSLTDPEALDAIFIATPDEITIGTKDPKAIAHHRGLGNLPARPVISMSQQQQRRIQKAIQAELVEFTRRAGFEVEERAA